MNIKLGEKIRTLRKQRNISQEVLSQYLGVLIYFCDFSRFYFDLPFFASDTAKASSARTEKGRVAPSLAASADYFTCTSS